MYAQTNCIFLISTTTRCQNVPFMIPRTLAHTSKNVVYPKYVHFGFLNFALLKWVVHLETPYATPIARVHV